jgi:hypothetical protein
VAARAGDPRHPATTPVRPSADTVAEPQAVADYFAHEHDRGLADELLDRFDRFERWLPNPLTWREALRLYGAHNIAAVISVHGEPGAREGCDAYLRRVLGEPPRHASRNLLSFPAGW